MVVMRSCPPRFNRVVRGLPAVPGAASSQTPDRQGRTASQGSACPALRSAAAACPHTLLCGDPPDLACKDLGEPEVAIRPGGDVVRPAPVRPVRGEGESGEEARGGEAPNVVRVVRSTFGKPEVAIRSGGDAESPAALIRHTDPRNRELGDEACGGDAPDVVRPFGKPQVAILSGGDGVRPAAIRGPTGRWQGELSDAARGGDAPNLVHIRRSKPEVAIRPGRDAYRPAKLERTVLGQGELGDATRGGDAPDLAVDLVVSVAAQQIFGKPQVAIRPSGDALKCARRGDGELGDAAAGGDAPDLAHAIARAIIQEPEVAIRPGRDIPRSAPGHGEQGDPATGRDAPDLARAREPEVAIRSGGDAENSTGHVELGDGACCGPDGSAAQAQQADRDNYGGEKGG